MCLIPLKDLTVFHNNDEEGQLNRVWSLEVIHKDGLPARTTFFVNVYVAAIPLIPNNMLHPD